MVFVNSVVANFETPLSHQEEYHSAVYDNTDGVNSNGEIVERSKYDVNFNASKMPAVPVANKEDVIQSSAVAVPIKITALVISKEKVSTTKTAMVTSTEKVSNNISNKYLNWNIHNSKKKKKDPKILVRI